MRPPSSSGPTPESLFAGWLDRVVAGEAEDIDALCREHPEAASALRGFHGHWVELEAVVRQLELGQSLTDKLRTRFGSGIDPGVTLEDEGGSGDFTSEILSRLSGRGPGSTRYRVQGKVGHGGMGAVLRVWDVDLRRHLAMKVILGMGRGPGDSQAVDPRRLARFLEEAQVTGQLDHPGIVPVHELGLDAEGRVYFTMKLVKGQTLKEVFDELVEGEAGWTQTRVLGLILRVCEAMSYAHAKGVIHRDLKPANVMVGKFGEVYVMDWGLAKILGRADAKDLRIQEEPGPTSELRSERREYPDESPDSPLYTVDGDVLGTPAYMPPEQARGDMAAMGPHSDVYAVGAMLYHLLAGHMPYVLPGMQVSNHAVWRSVQAGPPEALEERAAGAAPELVAICDRAMAREAVARYPDMAALATDLSAYLEGRVVRAYETGAWAEARKWMRRNRPLAASIAAALVVALGGLSGVGYVQSKGREAERIQRQRADIEAEAAIAARDDVLRLSALQQLDDLTAEADRLWPAHPENIPRYEDWLERAEALMAEQPDHEAKLDELRKRARPWTAEEQAAYQATSPRSQELERARRELESLEAREAVLAGGDPGPEPTAAEVGVDSDLLRADAARLDQIARSLVDTARTSFGGERKGLFLARRAVETAGEAERAKLRETLALAYLALGRLDEAEEEGVRMVEEAPASHEQELEDGAERIRQAIEADLTPEALEKAQARMAKLRQRVASLEEELAARHDWAFDRDEDRWWHNQLSKLVSGFHAFTDEETGLLSAGSSPEHGWGVKRRLANARALRDGFAPDGDWARAWAAALPEIRAAYPGLALTPQLGLVPIGPDPASGLWEFAHLETGEPAMRGPDRKLILKGETGLVFVLLPGGTFRMGAQGFDPNGPNYDPQARRDEAPVHAVQLSPFFLSKYEMTQGQWVHLMGANPSSYYPGFVTCTLLCPVEQVTWLDCVKVMGRLGLGLPSEAQWEYGARGGTSTPWWTGSQRDSLKGAVNVADRAAARGGAEWKDIEDWPELDDGFGAHAPAGTYRPNPFGLDNIVGNVWEWCQDGYDYAAYAKLPIRDPVSPPEDFPQRVYRGGAFGTAAKFTRSAYRDYTPPGDGGNFLGLRPVRAITP